MILCLVHGRGAGVSLDDLPYSFREYLDDTTLGLVELKKVWAHYYGTPYHVSSAPQVQQLLGEVRAIRHRHREREATRLIRERKIHARDANVRNRIVEGLLAGDVVLGVLDSVIELCEHAIETNDTILATGD